MSITNKMLNKIDDDIQVTLIDDITKNEKEDNENSI